MVEYIDKNDLREYISGYVKSCNGKPTHTDMDAMVGIISLLEQMPAADVQPVNRWIKADESLPVYGGMVLICDKSKNIRLGIYTDMGWCSQFGNPMMCKITHWQSLPEPPKDGDAK